MVGVEVPFTPVSSVEDTYVLFNVISTLSYVQSTLVKKRYLGSVPPNPPLAPALLVAPAYSTNGWLAPGAPGKASTARLLKYGDAAPSWLMLARMLLNPRPPANPLRLMEEKSTVSDSPGANCGWNTNPIERDTEVAGLRFGLFPSSPLKGRPE